MENQPHHGMPELAQWQAEGSGASQPQESNEVIISPDISTLLANIHSDDLLPGSIDLDDVTFEALAHFNGHPSQSYSSDTEASYLDLSLFTGPTSSEASAAPRDPASLSPHPLAQATTDDCFDGGVLGLAVDPRLQEDSTLTTESQYPILRAPQDRGLLGTMLSDGPQTSSVAMTEPGLQSNALPAKIGNRFSKESIQVLRRWLALHSRYPYPTDEEKETLQRQTGLTKTQISNWFTNTRRKRKSQLQRDPFSHTDNPPTSPIDISHRLGTPIVNNTNPLQRWVDSPPESEPASVAAIARAVASNREGSSGTGQNYRSTLTDEDSDRSLGHGTSASSAATSSGSSFASAHSHRSNDSFGPSGKMDKLRSHRRRRRRIIPERKGRTSLINPQKPFQCTFCAEAFRTKHDWQRHEKSLHLSLEKWVCTPEGSRAVNPTTNRVCCVFCGLADPDDVHLETHNHTACNVRPVENKSFYRKDHLNQHLKLVHDAQFIDRSMENWRVTTSEVQSRCGFCGMMMSTWPARVEHLAEHFKNGSTMADWKGDWGFEASVLDMVESSIPPYLIEMERTSTFPFTANSAPADSPRSAYELITIELAYFVVNYKEETGDLPTDKEMQLEACRVIFASEVSSLRGLSTESSWLRDLLMGDKEIAREAQFAPLRHGAENRLCSLQINGKDNLFEECPLELQLKEFVQAKAALGVNMTDEELQEECCYVIGNIRELPLSHYDFIADWLIRLAMSSAAWLVDFRQRTCVQRRQHYAFTLGPFEGGIQTSDNYQSHIAAHDTVWPAEMQHRQSRSPRPGVASMITSGAQQQQSGGLESGARSRRSPGAFEDMMKKTFFINDSNCYRRLAQELTRFVMSTMSPNNPSRHVPSDAEIQHQARWILFDSDDPWNQTAADNDEWLQRFKRDVGIGDPSIGGDQHL